MEDMTEIVCGIGTMSLSEPTTLCEVARAYSFVTEETPVIKRVEAFLRKYNLAPQGHYDEDGNWSPSCGCRRRCAYSDRVYQRGEVD